MASSPDSLLIRYSSFYSASTQESGEVRQHTAFPADCLIIECT